MEENKISPSIISLFVTIINDGKYRNERCEKFNKKLDDHEIEIYYFIQLKDHLQRILTVSCCDYFFHTPSRNHLEEHMSKHCGMHRQQKEQGNLYLALRLFLLYCAFWKFQVRFCWTTCTLCLPENF